MEKRTPDDDVLEFFSSHRHLEDALDVAMTRVQHSNLSTIRATFDNGIPEDLQKFLAKSLRIRNAGTSSSLDYNEMIAKISRNAPPPGRGLGGGRVCWGRAIHSDLSNAFDPYSDDISR